MQFSPSAVEGYLEKIQQIDTTRIDGKFIGDDGTTPERGQDQVELILSRCYSMADEAMQRYVFKLWYFVGLVFADDEQQCF
jgi:hypothetical protein